MLIEFNKTKEITVPGMNEQLNWNDDSEDVYG